MDIWSVLFGVTIATLILSTCFILKLKFSIENSGAIAAAYSVSAVTL
jgi:hypothetical protein